MGGRCYFQLVQEHSPDQASALRRLESQIERRLSLAPANHPFPPPGNTVPRLSRLSTHSITALCNLHSSATALRAARLEDDDFSSTGSAIRVRRTERRCRRVEVLLGRLRCRNAFLEQPFSMPCHHRAYAMARLKNSLSMGEQMRLLASGIRAAQVTQVACEIPQSCLKQKPPFWHSSLAVVIRCLNLLRDPNAFFA